MINLLIVYNFLGVETWNDESKYEGNYVGGKK